MSGRLETNPVVVRRPLRRQACRTRLICALLGAIALALAGPLFAQPFASDTIERIKPSIVAVGTFERLRSPAFSFLGTGFVVGDGLTVATNDHVLAKAASADKGDAIAIAIPAPGNKSAQIRSASKLAADPESDLALLRVDGPALPAMQLGNAEHVREGETYLFTGFPIGSVLGLFPVTHRSMVAAISPFAIPAARADRLDARAARRLSGTGFSVFQLDAVAYPGNSGSPVYHPETGAVIGIVNSVFVKGSREAAITHPSGITYAIPSQRLKALLERSR